MRANLILDVVGIDSKNICYKKDISSTNTMIKCFDGYCIKKIVNSCIDMKASKMAKKIN